MCRFNDNCNSEENIKMSDSDSELLLPSNVFTFQNESTMVSARGPKTIANNITGISFQNNVLSSTMRMPLGYERQRYAESNYDQRSFYRRRASPMSIRSACDARPRGFRNYSYYPARSVINGRSGSPMSQRSIESSASVVSAADIAVALKSGHFSMREVRKINMAHKCMMKKLRGRRRESSDSGEQGSDSSLSSDEISTRTSNYKENMSCSKSTKTYISAFRRKKESYTDCTENYRHNSTHSYTNGLDVLNNTHASLGSQRTINAVPNMTSWKVPANFNSMQKKHTIPEMTQRDRFRTGLLLPSQKFNNVAPSAIHENAEHVKQQNDRFKSRFPLPSQRFNRFVPSSSMQEDTEVINDKRDNLLNGVHMNKNTATNFNIDSDSDDNIFSDATSKKKTNDNIQRKRSVDSVDDISLPDSKRAKVASPCKNSVEARQAIGIKNNFNNNNVANDFIFAKPQFPVRKTVKEKLISKSGPSTLDSFVQASMIPPTNEAPQQRESIEQEKEDQSEPSNATQNTTDLSMRPSFIKRKLFTQKLDVSEKRNMSTDSANSPMNSIYGDIQKEKHKARKLQQATTQSCLSRDVQQDENNLLDLIQKVVPLEQMNATSHTNRTELQNGTNKSIESEDKWDVTSIISTRKNNEDGSDTYTDEELFNATVKEFLKDGTKTSSPIQEKKVPRAVSNKSLQTKGKHPLLMKPSPIKKTKVLVKETVSQKLSPFKTNDSTSKINVQKCIKSFWDTDFESDAECQQPPRFGNLSLKKNQFKETMHLNDVKNFERFNLKKPIVLLHNDVSTLQNSTVANTSKFNSTSFRVRSHRTTKRKIPDLTNDDDAGFANFEPQHKIQKTLQTRICEVNVVDQNEKSKETGSKPHSKQGLKHLEKSKAPEIGKHNETTESVLESPSEKQTKYKIKQVKTVQNKTFNNNEKEIVKSKRGRKKGTVNNKENKTTQNSDIKQDSTKILKQTTKQITDSQKLTETKEATSKNKRSVTDKKSEIENQSNVVNKKSELVQNITKNKKTTNKPTTVTEKQAPKRKYTKKAQQDQSFNADISIEENNNSGYRPMRSCRISKNDESFNNSNLPMMMSRTLRTRQIDLSSTFNGNTTKVNRKVVNHTKDAKSRLSDISFSLASGSNTVAKRAVTKMTNSRLLRSKDVETSDISFSLGTNESPPPKRAISAKTRVNSKTSKKQNEIRNHTPLKKNNVQTKNIFVSKNESKPSRIRFPNKKYSIC